MISTLKRIRYYATRSRLVPLHLTEYCTAHSTVPVPPSAHQALLHAETHNKAHQCISQLQGQFMTTLLRHSQAKNVLELGGFTGYSASWLMGGGRHVTVIEKDREHVTRIAALNLQDVRVIHSTALDYLTTCTQKYDLVFLDANKSGYRDCLDIILTNEILTPHGLLVADNVLFRGDVTTPSTKTAHHMHDFNVHTSQDKRIHAVILPVFDGLALIQYSSNV